MRRDDAPKAVLPKRDAAETAKQNKGDDEREAWHGLNFQVLKPTVFDTCVMAVITWDVIDLHDPCGSICP